MNDENKQKIVAMESDDDIDIEADDSDYNVSESQSCHEDEIMIVDEKEEDEEDDDDIDLHAGNDCQSVTTETAPSFDTNDFRSAFANLIGIRNQMKMIKQRTHTFKEEQQSNMDLSEDFIKRKFKKEDSVKLEIVGQINRGFIICKLETDIFYHRSACNG